MDQKQKPLILVDGSSFLFRAYHALPLLTNKDGHPTNAMLGMLNMLRRLIQDYQPNQMLVVFDSKQKNFRHELYPHYKANREAMPDELAVQIAPLQHMIKLLGLPLLIKDGVEADDVIGTVAKTYARPDRPVLISTGDKDMTQLVNGNVQIVNTMTNVTMDSSYVQQRFGVNPEQIIDFLALVGDSSDNIPGIPKVGAKTAAKWLAQYGDLATIKAHADEIKGKVGESLRAHLEQLDLAQQLVTINTGLELTLSEAAMQVQAPDRIALRSELAKWGFHSWLKELEQEDTSPREQQPNNYQCITKRSQWHNWLAKMQQAKLIAIDTETTSLDALQADLVGISFAIDDGQAAYLPLQHDYLGAPQQLNDEQTRQELVTLLADHNVKKVGQHLKYDVKVLAKAGFTVQGIIFDTLLAAYILNPSGERYDLASLAKKHLNTSMIGFEDIAGAKGKHQLTFNQIDLEQAAPYAAEDADITLRLYRILQDKLQQQPKLHQVFTEIEMPILMVLAQMELHGVLIDQFELAKQSQFLAEQIAQLEARAHDEAGQSFNLSSPQQLQQILFTKMQIPSIKKTPKGQPSTAESVLQELSCQYKLPAIILEHRHLSKLKSTYTDKLPRMINQRTGRVHTRYHQAVTSTGRLSSTDPNLQNIPIRTEAGRRIRHAFIAPDGYTMLAADYSQIELRIMAHLSGDQGLITSFKNNEDIHSATAAEVFGLQQEQVDQESRRRAKAINFGLIYGMSAYGLARQLGIERSKAQQYIDIYFDRYPKVANYMASTRDMARQQGYVETVFGRRLYLPEINARNGKHRLAAERAAINAPMQGTAADIIKLAMLRINNWLAQQNSKVQMIMQVHDELIFEVPTSLDIAQISTDISNLMIDVPELSVPLVVATGTGSNWDQAH